MSDVDHYLSEGRISDLVEATKQTLRRDPANLESRLCLFELFSLQGEWARALTQLQIAGDQSPDCAPMCLVYSSLLKAEAERVDVFAGVKSPTLLGSPPEWIAWCLAALKEDAQGNTFAAAKLRSMAQQAAPLITAAINEEPAGALTDMDSRMGLMLELIIDGRYLWAPLQAVAQLTATEPGSLRDLLWCEAELTWRNGTKQTAYIPVRYPGSETCNDPLIQLARSTEWKQIEGGYTGLGQRMFAVGDREYGLLDIRQLQIHPHQSPNAGGGDE